VTTLSLLEVQSKINAISALFSIIYNESFLIQSQAYTTHKHSYTDTTINDTEDGTGTATITIKTTGEVQ
jgi:hypothetical protein